MIYFITTFLASTCLLIASSYEPSQQVLPLLNDEKETLHTSFRLSTSKSRTLTGIVVDTEGTTNLEDIKQVSVFINRKKGDLLLGTGTLTGKIVTLNKSTEIPKGNHTGKITVTVKKEADITHRVGLQITAIHFEDGDNLLIKKDSHYVPARLAYNIHKRGQGNCHTFRIPAIAKANDGTLLAVYDMRYNSRKDLQEHMDIGLSRSTDGGQTWTKPEPIMDMGEYGGKSQKENGCSDPGIIVDTKTGEIIVTACWTHGKPNTHQWIGKGSEPGMSIHETTQFMAVRSKNNGKTWSQPENWTKALKDPEWHLFAPAPGNGITMSDGTLVMPTQGRDVKGLPFSNIICSKDHGKTWTVSNHARDNTTECAIVELSDGSLMLNMRDNRNRSDKSETNGRAVSVTNDLGKTWSTHSSDHGLLPEPVCMASLISFRQPNGKTVLLFSNPNSKKGRHRMTIQVSLDDGKNWPKENHLLLDSNGGAYSSLVMIDAKTVGILYESSAADMIFQKIPLSDLLK